MKTLKTFIAQIEKIKIKNKDSKEKLPSIETMFGNHSMVDNKEKLPSIETMFGDHSIPKNIKESVDLAKDKLDDSDHDEEKIHKNNEVSYNSDISEHYSVDSGPLNKYLHNRYNKEDKDEEFDNYAKSIDKHLDKHKTKHDFYVYTGLSRPPHKFFEGHDKDTVTFHHPAYLSTSTNFRKASEFARIRNEKEDIADSEKHKLRNEDPGNKYITSIPTRHVLKLHVPKGTKGGSIREQASYRDENEVLLHRGHNIEIHRHPSISYGHKGLRFAVWHGKIVGHDKEDLDK